jgi:protein-L-isoaspartate(D-aspartate) O-methyltransferase
MVDFTLQRTNMVESQVRPSDITDRRIIRAMLDVPREQFCPATSRATAYMDLDVKVSPTRYLTATRVLAKLIQGLDSHQ